MKLFSISSDIVVLSFTLSTINFGFSQPAQAAIVCETGTITSYQNGSLANCILGQNVNVQVSSRYGISNFPCQVRNYISFNDQGQFQSCELSEAIQIRKGNSVEICLAEYKIDFSVSNDGTQSIICRR